MLEDQDSITKCRPRAYQSGEPDVSIEQARSNCEDSQSGPDSLNSDLFTGAEGHEETTVRPSPDHIRKALASTPWRLNASSTPLEVEIFDGTGGHEDTTVRPTPEHIRRMLERTQWRLPSASSNPTQG
jgi:hypothetical protein